MTSPYRMTCGTPAGGAGRVLPFVIGVIADPRRDSARRGLDHLERMAGASTLVRLDVLDRDRQAVAQEFEDGALHRWLHEPLTRAGGEPFGLLLVDIDITDQAADIAFLERLGAVCGDCLVPVLLPASSETVMASAGWQALRASQDARFVALVADIADDPALDVNGVTGPFIVAGRIVAAFARNEWAPSFMVSVLDGPDTGIAVADGTASHPRATALEDMGVLAVLRRDGAALLTGATTLARPPSAPVPAAARAARAHATLPPILGGARVMHYLLVQYAALSASRDAADLEPEVLRLDLERRLIQWLMSYWAHRSGPPAPLNDALVRLSPDPARPGFWWMVAHLMPAWEGGGALPHSARFTASVPAPRRA
ncbi:type VI secretion system contractile sheath domain-containing protein [Vineibacter terrae]|uniref:type VI secretion system contractile sheath domain-containing protein n=1 Tax=Vineibacter terrae TaxID=2586908 RepID=UPI002E31DC76|nr:type VI secretion system contractile sheath large subunit [Vineibacter terrae]HEX2890868.1 type VI secretion system contractile sheath large subunit [Vineibacter terrae]